MKRERDEEKEERQDEGKTLSLFIDRQQVLQPPPSSLSLFVSPSKIESLQEPSLALFGSPLKPAVLHADADRCAASAVRRSWHCHPRRRSSPLRRAEAVAIARRSGEGIELNLSCIRPESAALPSSGATQTHRARRHLACLLSCLMAGMSSRSGIARACRRTAHTSDLSGWRPRGGQRRGAVRSNTEEHAPGGRQ